MAINWVDFKAVKESVTMLMVLEHYKLAGTLKKKGDELRGKCPLHGGEGDNSFHVSLSKNAYKCFSCAAKGNVLDFVAAKEKCSVRDAALKLAEWFNVVSSPATMTRAAKGKQESNPDSETEQTAAVSEQPEAERGEEKIWPAVKEETEKENPPLGFELQGIQFDHPYLAERGIDERTARHFGVGYFPGKGSMHGRVVIPIHDSGGRLVAYAGRSIDGSEPKYKFPSGFKKGLVLYNLCRVNREAFEPIVVEGFFDCMRIWQLGEENVVALMGCQMSAWQEQELGEFCEVVLMLDGDEAGRKATAEILLRLARRTYVKDWGLEDGKQPDSLTAEDFEERV